MLTCSVLHTYQLSKTGRLSLVAAVTLVPAHACLHFSGLSCTSGFPLAGPNLNSYCPLGKACTPFQQCVTSCRNLLGKWSDTSFCPAIPAL